MMILLLRVIMLIENTDSKTVKKTYEWFNEHTTYGKAFHGESFKDFLLSLKGISSILDIGTGKGQFCDWAINNLCSLVYGLDLAIKPDSKFLDLGINFLLGSSSNIPLSNDTVDITVSFDVLEHIRPEDIKNTITEMDRVTKKYMLHKISYRAASTRAHRANPYVSQIGNLHLIQQDRKWWVEKFKEYLPNSTIYQINRCLFIIKNV